MNTFFEFDNAHTVPFFVWILVFIGIGIVGYLTFTYFQRKLVDFESANRDVISLLCAFCASVAFFIFAGFVYSLAAPDVQISQADQERVAKEISESSGLSVRGDDVAVLATGNTVCVSDDVCLTPQIWSTDDKEKVAMSISVVQKISHDTQKDQNSTKSEISEGAKKMIEEGVQEESTNR